MKIVATFASFIVYTRTLLKTQKSIKVSTFFSFPTNMVLNKVQKVGYKMIFINSQFIM